MVNPSNCTVKVCPTSASIENKPFSSVITSFPVSTIITFAPETANPFSSCTIPFTVASAACISKLELSFKTFASALLQYKKTNAKGISFFSLKCLILWYILLSKVSHLRCLT